MINDTPAQKLDQLLGVKQWHMHERFNKNNASKKSYDYKTQVFQLLQGNYLGREVSVCRNLLQNTVTKTKKPSFS